MKFLSNLWVLAGSAIAYFAGKWIAKKETKQVKEQVDNLHKEIDEVIQDVEETAKSNAEVASMSHSDTIDKLLNKWSRD